MIVLFGFEISFYRSWTKVGRRRRRHRVVWSCTRSERGKFSCRFVMFVHDLHVFNIVCVFISVTIIPTGVSKMVFTSQRTKDSAGDPANRWDPLIDLLLICINIMICDVFYCCMLICSWWYSLQWIQEQPEHWSAGYVTNSGNNGKTVYICCLLHYLLFAFASIALMFDFCIFLYCFATYTPTCPPTCPPTLLHTPQCIFYCTCSLFSNILSFTIAYCIHLN